MESIGPHVLSVVLMASVTALGQTFPTIPESLARANASLTSGATIPSGPAPTLDSVLSNTDLIVRGTLGEPRSYLSDDQRAVLTDYPLLNASVLYERKGLPLPPTLISQPLAVTLLGGMIEINGLTFTERPAALPALDPGDEHVLCLKMEKGKLLIALQYFGAFAVRDGHLTPLTRKRGFAPEAQQAPTEQMIAVLKSRAQALHAQQTPK